MKAMLFAAVVVIAVIGAFAVAVYRDPNRVKTREALAVLYSPPSEVPQDPATLGYLNLKQRHPDGVEGPDEFRNQYSAELAIQRMDQVEGFLTSFSRLTRLSKGRVLQKELSEAGNTDPEMQTIGFHNIPLVVEGTILKQDYLLKQAEYKLAQLQHLGGNVTTIQLEEKRLAYDRATKSFQAFWDTKLPTD